MMRLLMRRQTIPRATALAAGLLMLLGLGVVVQAEHNARARQLSELRAQGEILAASVVAPIDFRDTEAMREVVAAVRGNPQILMAGVYDAGGRLIEGYARKEPLPPSLPTENINADPGSQALVPVMLGKERLGSIYLLSRAEPFGTRAARYGLIAVLVVLASLVVLILGVTNAALRDSFRKLASSNAALRIQIEEREKAEGQLRQAQKMESLGQLTGGIAHDFNNMLAIVIGSLDLARRRFSTSPEAALKGIENAMIGADRAAALTSRLLAFSRRQPLSPQALDTNKMVTGMSELLRRTLGEQVAIETVLSGGLWTIHADPSQLENAVLNLCLNARDAMPAGGRLTIETSNAELDARNLKGQEDIEAGAFIAIAITDTGIGMNREVSDRAFDPFFTTKDVGKGTGLGLSQVYGFARQSGGLARIYSEPGHGTTVTIYLPRHQQEIAEEDAPAAAGPVPEGRAEEVVLVVEDEEQVRVMSVETLRDLGYTVIEAANGRAALDALDDRPDIKLLFTDIVMPDMNGRVVAELACKKRPDLKVVYTTGYSRNAVLHEDGADPAMVLLSKPFTLDQLARKIRSTFDGVPA